MTTVGAGGGSGKGGTIVAVCVTAAFVAIVASFTVVAVTTDDPDVFFRFLGGQFLGNLGTFIVLIISAVLNRKVNNVAEKVATVEKNTNGTTTQLMRQNDEMTRHIMNNTEGTQG